MLRLLRTDYDADFHLNAVYQTAPGFIVEGRKYANCTLLYVVEMKQLDAEQPTVYKHLINGDFVVYRSSKCQISCVSTNQASEQTVNCADISQIGITGFTLRKSALKWWLLIRNNTG